MATILIVDERTLDPELAVALEHHGHHLLGSDDGEDALHIVRADAPDLVLTDILLPGGYQLVRQLRSDASLVQPRVVFLADASVETEARDMARACGASSIVTTPTGAGPLLAAVDAALAGPLPRAWKPRPGAFPFDAHLRQMAGKLYERLVDVQRHNAALRRQMAERAEQLEIARSALGQEVTKRLWAEAELTQSNRRLHDKALRDALTGLYNRGYLEESLRREESRARRSEKPFGLMMIDIDHFKRFNDTFGHAAGDAVLRRVGQHLLSLARAEDIPCRYGGEEFVLVMSHASPVTLRERAEKLRLGAQGLAIESDGRSVGPITLSVGIALFPEHGDSGLAVLQAADAAMYRAKAAGRNRVVVAEKEANPSQ
ncbi:MAG TPA: diguanylate cyclase [Burkholderiales bacterium]|nr:diguanylate cyclase [Burkholderiales bacterium]